MKYDTTLPADSAIEKALKFMLIGLGTTSAEVAVRLNEDGVSGLRGDCGLCPLANKVRDFLVGREDVEAAYGMIRTMVGSQIVEATWVDSQQSMHFISVFSPEGCAEFVRHFDSGFFPALEASSVTR